MDPSDDGTEITFIDRRDADVADVQTALRRLVRTHDRTQRSIEVENGFQAGYLSQVLQGHISLTMRHLLGILGSLGIPASTFFARLDQRDDDDPTPILSEIQERMARYDAALDELTDRGFLGDPAHQRNPKRDG